MRFTRKVFLLLGLCALPPVALLGWVSVRQGSQALEARVIDSQRLAAEQAADAIQTWITSAAEDLRRTCDYIPFDRFAPEDLAQAMRIPYRQLGWASAAVLLDSDGKPLAPAAHRAPGEGMPADRTVVDRPDLEAFAANVPLRAALARGEALSQPYLSASGEPRLAYARSFHVASGARWVLAAEASLAPIQSRLSRLMSGLGGNAYLVDAMGVLALHPRHEWVKARRSVARALVVGRGLLAGAVATARYRDLASREVVGAFAPVSAIGGGVVFEQPTAEAFAAVHRLGMAALVWTLVALLLAGFGAVTLARGVTAPVRDLAAAARAVGDGDYSVRLQPRSRDELGDLALAFNRMAAEVRAQQEEITTWTSELTARVEDRTRELREAHHQVVRSEKLAATAELAAGVAHELNNPLTAILGLGQVLVAASTNGVKEHLQEIVDQAARMRDIVRGLMRFARPTTAGKQALDVNRVVQEALEVQREKIEKRRIEVVVDCTARLPAVDGSASDLLLAFLHLVTNAIEAMPKGGKLDVQTRVIDHTAVKVVFRDTGVGIEPERLARIFEPFYTNRAVGKERSGGGLGLAVAHRIVEEHGGRISVESTPGAGATFTLFFPGLRQELHLR